MRTALIIGGGIAGPTTALALQKAGFEPIVFEAYPDTGHEVGSYFSVAPNGLDALRVLDAHHLAVAVGFPTYRNVLWNDSGQRLASIGLGQPLDDGTVSQTIKRARLTRALRDEAIRRGILVEFGKRLIDARTSADGRVTAQFEDGTEATGDLLVGTDGIHSVVRGIIDPRAPRPRYLGLTNFGGVTLGAKLDAESEAWHFIFGRRAFFGYCVDPMGDVVWFANVPRPEITPAERASTSLESWQRQLVELLADDQGPAAGLIQAGQLELAGDNTFDLPHVPHWHRGPMIVIGDAAHAPSPSSGQGASMAMEDAVVLAQALRDVADVPDALAVFEQLRRPRVERVVAQGARSSSSKTPGPVGRLMRDLILRVMFRYFVSDQSLAWMYDYRVEWERPVVGPASQALVRPAA